MNYSCIKTSLYSLQLGHGQFFLREITHFADQGLTLLAMLSTCIHMDIFFDARQVFNSFSLSTEVKSLPSQDIACSILVKVI